jgi:hypothetical protein
VPLERGAASSALTAAFGGGRVGQFALLTAAGDAASDAVDEVEDFFGF